MSGRIDCLEADAAEHYPLTHPQMGIWYMERLYPGISMGNICATLRLLSAVDFPVLERALNLFLEKNDATRLRMIDVDGQPRQYVRPYEYKHFEFFDFSGDINALYSWDEKQTQQPFDIIDSDLIYIAMIKVGESDGGFYIKMHHLAADAWSMISCGSQVLEYYHLLKSGQTPPAENKPSFLDAIEAEVSYKQSNRFIKDRDFWRDKFADWQEATVLKSRKTSDTGTKARRKTLLLPQKLSAKLHTYCADNNVSEFSLFIAAVSMYINRVTGREDVTLGTTFLNRTNQKEKDTLGMFASIAVPIRLTVTDDMNFADFIRCISKETMSALRHQKYPYDLLLGDVRERLKTTDSLFDIVLSYQNSKVVKSPQTVPFSSRWHFNGHQLESLIINLNDRESDGRLVVDYDYLAAMFYSTEIEFIHQHVISLLWHALDNPQRPIAQLEMISELEKQKILYKFNETAAPFPSDKTAHAIFEQQAARTPDNIAVWADGKTLTYRQVNEKANRLARTLREHGLKPDRMAGLMVYRSAEMIIGILGILKAGGAYLPIDPNYPADRIDYVLENSGAQFILVHDKTKDIYEAGVCTLNLDDESSYSGDDTNPENVNSPRDLAYVIYTSGSTGRPKGVMLEHRGLVNRLHWMQKRYPLTKDSVILQKTPFTFDVSVWELMLWFFSGASVCMLKPNGEKDPQAIIDAIRTYRITTMHFVPSMLSSFMEFLDGYRDIGALASLKQVFASGEALGLSQTVKFNRLLNASNGTELYNLYGPTEATIDVSYFDCSPDVTLKTVPIGKPIDNIRLYILDKHLNLLPIGIAGELCIGGIGVARGYVSNPALTAEKFIQNPFVPGDIIYKTGDLARWYAQGDIEYLGRLDHQLKIRGYRIELGEIENRLLAHRDIREAVALGLEEDGKKFLCAYYVSDTRLPVRELKRFLAAAVPEYMVPSYFVHMDAFPLSSNGKINRKALPKPGPDEADAVAYAPPRNETEEKLAEIYAQVLDKPRVGIDDSLFDLGGDSLSIIQIYSRIYDFGWGVTAADFYTYQTIRELADKISGVQPAAAQHEAIETLEWRSDSVPDKLEAYSPSGILLTGATGFLGIHILAELMDATDAAVYCLVRGETQSEAETRLKRQLHFYFGNRFDPLSGTRIFAVQGDVTRKRLGLPASEYAQLGEKVDTVIHSAAMVKYFGDYEQIRLANVVGTQEAIAFALSGSCRFHHISTVSITGNYLANNTESGTFTENDFYIGQNYHENLYVRSKFEAENLVLRAAKQGLHATIHRMGNLTGRYSDGKFQPNIEENGFYSAMKSVIDLGAVSDVILNEKIEFSPIDLAAQAIVKIVLTNQSCGHIFHVFNPYVLTISELLHVLGNIDIPIRAMKHTQLKQIMRNSSGKGISPEAYSGMAVYLKENGDLAYPAPFDIEADFTCSYLNKLGFQWPGVNEDYLETIIGYLRDLGFLSA